MTKIRVGVDIGSDGAIAIFSDGQLVKYVKLPKVADELDMRGMTEILLTYPLEDIHILMEDLHSVFGAGAASNFTFGVNNGLVVGALQALQLPYSKIGAKKWQKIAWEGIRPVEKAVMKKIKGQPAFHEKNKKGELKYKTDTKQTSLIAAKRIFPKETFLATERSSVPHNGIVDAALIGWVCARMY